MNYSFLNMDWIAWRNQWVIATLKSPFNMQLSIDLWKPEPLAEDPQLEYSVNGRAPLPDLLGTGTVRWLMSKRFLDLLHRAGVLFESFPVKLYDRKSGEVVQKEFEVFHLLKVQPIVDLNRSNIKNNEHIERIELIEFGEEGPKMARDSYLGSKVFVREDLREQIISAGITGCNWDKWEDYQFIIDEILPWKRRYN